MPLFVLIYMENLIIRTVKMQYAMEKREACLKKQSTDTHPE